MSNKFSIQKLKELMVESGYKVNAEDTSWGGHEAQQFVDFMYFKHGFSRTAAQNALGYPEAFLPPALFDACAVEDEEPAANVAAAEEGKEEQHQESSEHENEAEQNSEAHEQE